MVNILPSEDQHNICEYSGFLIIFRFTYNMSCVLWMKAAVLLVLRFCIWFISTKFYNYKALAYIGLCRFAFTVSS
jgi:hypothetical protein